MKNNTVGRGQERGARRGIRCILLFVKCVCMRLFYSLSVALVENTHESSNSSHSCSQMGEFGCPLLTVYLSSRQSRAPGWHHVQRERLRDSCCFAGVTVWWHHLPRSLVGEMPCCREKLVQALQLSSRWICSCNLRHLAIEYFLWFPFLIILCRNKSTLTRIKGSDRWVILCMVMRKKKKNFY